VTQVNGQWGFDPELGIDRQRERPILMVRGAIQEGTQSPTTQFRLMLEALRKAQPSLRERSNPEPARGRFSIDLSLYGEPLQVADVDEGEGQ
jgi:hypothetical protein